MEKILNKNKGAGWYAAVLLMLVSVFGQSCKKDIYDEFDPNTNRPLALTANKDAIVLAEAEFSKDVLELNWTSGSNLGTNNSISYTLYIDKQGNNFQSPVVENLGKTTFQKKYNAESLNTLALNGLNLTPGVESVLEAKLVSNVSGTDYADSTTVAFKVTPYQPVTTTLFLIGDATPNGWSADNATALVKNESFPGRFTWQGKLNTGEFKFITTKGSFSPSYNKGASDNLLVLRTSDTQPDNKFIVTKTGTYTVTVDLLNLTISVEEGAAPPYSQLWIVGDATPNGWNIDNPNQLHADRSDPFVFTYGEVLKAGEFKFPTAKGNWGGDFYMPLTNHQALTATGVKLVPGGSPDNKWQITTAGAYKIKLNITPGANTIEIKPFTAPAQLWIVGDATPAGWNINSPTPLVKDANDPYVFTYTGELKAGEFKIPTATGDWGTDFYMPVIANEGATSTEMKFVPGGNPDNKWRITAAQAGLYKVTIDVLRETIKFEKQ